MSKLASTQKHYDNFTLGVMPLSPEFIIASAYPHWVKKRLSYREMVQEAEKLATVFSGNLIASLDIFYMGDFSSKGKTSVDIRDDIKDYIFVENDRGKFVRCAKADVPPMGSPVNMINDSTTIQLCFPIRDSEGETILDHTSTLTFVVDGLGLDKAEFRFQYPFTTYFESAPASFKRIYRDIGLWK